MPDFSRWGSNGGDPSLNAIGRTDRFLDALATERPVYSTDVGEAELARVLAGWRDDVRRAPATTVLSQRDAAVLLRRTLTARQRTRASLIAIGSMAASVLCLGGFGAMVYGAGPNDALYGLRSALFGQEHVSERQVVLAAQSELTQVQQLIDQGQWSQAQVKLSEVSTTVQSVDDNATKQQLQDQWNRLNVKVVSRDPRATLPPSAVPSAADVPPAGTPALGIPPLSGPPASGPPPVSGPVLGPVPVLPPQVLFPHPEGGLLPPPREVPPREGPPREVVPPELPAPPVHVLPTPPVQVPTTPPVQVPPTPPVHVLPTPPVQVVPSPPSQVVPAVPPPSQLVPPPSQLVPPPSQLVPPPSQVVPAPSLPVLPPPARSPLPVQSAPMPSPPVLLPHIPALVPPPDGATGLPPAAQRNKPQPEPGEVITPQGQPPDRAINPQPACSIGPFSDSRQCQRSPR
jgi:hypothetical protein